MGGTPSEGLYTAVFRGRRENLVYVDVYTYNLCAKRKSDETTSSASDNTYQLGVSVLDVPSISNTKKAGGLLPTRGLTIEKVRTILLNIGKALFRHID
jgi:hypothetical protein